MADLISRAAAIEAALDGADEWDGGYNPERERCIREHMAKVSPVDAVSVVRCRDCKWGIVVTTDEDCEHVIAYCNNPDCPVWEAYIAVKPDWYCADGERRESE